MALKPEPVPLTPGTGKIAVQEDLDRLVALAISLGASDACGVASEEIVVQDALAGYCLEPRCPSYGLSFSCPPHVSGPDGFRKLRKALARAVVVRIVLPMEILHSSQRWEVTGLLHQIVSGIEAEAVRMGYAGSRAFAGGSCKQIFCRDHQSCRRLSENGTCRHPAVARPSMSGFGVDVSGLMKTCGWPSDIKAGKEDDDPEAMTWVAGLVLVGTN